MKRDYGLDALLNMDDFEYHFPNGYWYKIEVRAALIMYHNFWRYPKARIKALV